MINAYIYKEYDNDKNIPNEVKDIIEMFIGIEIFIKTLTGKTLTMKYLLPTDTINNLKKRIADIEGIPPEQQKIIFAGQHLDDDVTLESYNIGYQYTLHLTLHLRC
eukprot:327971_1